MTATTSDPSSTSPVWAKDSNNGELDTQLKPAQRQAEQEYLDGEADDQGGPLEEPILLRNLLNDEQIAQILEEASVDGVWPRGLYNNSKKDGEKQEDAPSSSSSASSSSSSSNAGEQQQQDDDSANNSNNKNIGKSTVPRSELSDALRSAPHHFAWTDGHVVLYMHNNNHWFVRRLKEAWSVIRGGMEARSWMNGAVPVLDMDFVGLEGGDEDIRTVELHHYGPGGGLTTPGHRDCGSELTISVLLSDSELVSGGDFVTYDKGVPIAHKMNRGDAILFNSLSLHNISTITAGLRKSLVVELWPSKRY